MKNTYCTLFNKAYLVKGLALHSSMRRNISDFHLYILAMDECTETALNRLKLDNVTVISTADVIDEQLNEVLGNRLGPAFFWTCTPLVIEYVLTNLGEEWCTYVDADCFFFGDPGKVFDVIEDRGYLVGIVEHRFRRDESYYDHIDSDGRFNVAFNVFRNEENSLAILREWKEQCLLQCTNKPTEGYFGDQLYLNEWPERYQRVYIIEDEGIDVAPWNVNNYKVTRDGASYRISNGTINELIKMYHFHTLNHISKHIVSLNLWNTKKRSEIRDLLSLYRDYIDECTKLEAEVEEYINNAADDKGETISKKIQNWISKYRNRKENGLIQMIRNVMWV